MAPAYFSPSVGLSDFPKKLVSLGIFLILLVNMIQTEPFQQGPSNLVHLLLMIRRQHLLLFKVRGGRSRSHARYYIYNKIKTESFGLGL